MDQRAPLAFFLKSVLRLTLDIVPLVPIPDKFFYLLVKTDKMLKILLFLIVTFTIYRLFLYGNNKKDKFKINKYTKNESKKK